MSPVQLESFDRRAAWQEDHVPNLRMVMVMALVIVMAIVVVTVMASVMVIGDASVGGDGDAGGGGGGDRGARQGDHAPHHHCHGNLELQESKPHSKASSWSLAESLESMWGPGNEQIIFAIVKFFNCSGNILCICIKRGGRADLRSSFSVLAHLLALSSGLIVSG